MENLKKLLNHNKWNEIYTEIIDKKITNYYDEISGSNTIAHLAAINNNSKIIKYFLKNEPNVLIKSNEDGDTPIHLLASYGYTDLLKECIKSDQTYI